MRTTKMFDDSDGTSANDDHVESDFAFLYEEDDDPEVFFVPYVWEVIVCAVTASYLEWDKRGVKVFSTEDEEDEEDDNSRKEKEATTEGTYSKDVMDVV